jgi:hypothetical protein
MSAGTLPVRTIWVRKFVSHTVFRPHGFPPTNAAFAHHAHQIPVAQLETQVPPNAQYHNLGIEMASGEQFIR